jgi:hypothetical protein
MMMMDMMAMIAAPATEMPAISGTDKGTAK